MAYRALAKIPAKEDDNIVRVMRLEVEVEVEVDQLSASEVSLNSHSDPVTPTNQPTGHNYQKPDFIFCETTKKDRRKNVMQAISVPPRLNIFA